MQVRSETATAFPCAFTAAFYQRLTPLRVVLRQCKRLWAADGLSIPMQPYRTMDFGGEREHLSSVAFPPFVLARSHLSASAAAKTLFIERSSPFHPGQRDDQPCLIHLHAHLFGCRGRWDD